MESPLIFRFLQLMASIALAGSSQMSCAPVAFMATSSRLAKRRWLPCSAFSRYAPLGTVTVFCPAASASKINALKSLSACAAA